MDRRKLIISLMKKETPLEFPEEFLVIKSNKNIKIGFFAPRLNPVRGPHNMYASFDKGLTWINMYDENQVDFNGGSINEYELNVMSYEYAKEIWIYGTSNTMAPVIDYFDEYLTLKYEVYNDNDEGLEISVEGDIMSLILNPKTYKKYPYLFNLHSLFKNWTHMIAGPEISVTSVGSNALMDIFYNCSSMISGPTKLPKNISAYSFQRMFYNCSSLINAPELPATNIFIGSYDSMFKGCSSLTNVPGILSATTLHLNCYKSMFQDCSSLVNAPELPAISLADGCYYSMFKGCSSLVLAPKLPAPYIEKDSYTEMFYDCSSLTTVWLGKLERNGFGTGQWLYGVPDGGTMYKSGDFYTAWSVGLCPVSWTQVPWTP